MLKDDTLINIARLCFGLNMFTTLPLELFVCREVWMSESHGGRHELTVAQVVEQFFFSHEGFSYQRHLVFTTVILFSSMFSKSNIHSLCHFSVSSFLSRVGYL